MANGNVTLPANTWTKFADSGLTAASWQNKGGNMIHIAATAADSAPSGDPDEWPEYERGEGERGVDATAMFSGVTGASYLWAYSPGYAGKIWRSHA